MTAPTVVSTRRFIRSRQNVLFPILDVLLNLFNWGFHVLVSWFLVPQAYGELNSLLALLSLLMVLGVALQLLTARHVASQGTEVAPALERLALYTAGGTCATGLLCLPLLMWLTRSSALSIVLVLVIFVLNAVLSVRRGIVQGQTTFLSLNGSFYLEVAVKLVATALFLYLWRRPEAALVGVATGMGASLWASWRRAPMPPYEATMQPIRPWLRRLSPIFAASFFLYFFSAIDMLMVNRLLPNAAGLYAVAIKYGQILFFAALSVSTVFVPQLSQVHEDKVRFASLSLRLVGLLTMANIAALVASRTFLPQTVVPVFGPSYLEATPLLSWAMLAYGLLSLCFCLVNILVISEKRAYLFILLLFAVAVVTLLSFYHHSLTQVLQILAVTYGLLLIPLAAMVVAKFREMSYVTYS